MLIDCLSAIPRWRRKVCLHGYLSVILLIAVALPANGLGKMPAGHDTASVTMEQLIRNFYEDKKDLSQVYIFRHSPEYFTRFEQFYKNWIQQLSRVNFQSLPVSDRVDYLLLKRSIESGWDALKSDAADFEKYQYAIPFSGEIIRMQQKRRRGDKADGMEAAKICNDIVKRIQQAKDAVSSRSLSDKSIRRQATDAVQELHAGLKNVYDFYHGYDPAFDWWVSVPYQQADSALKAYGAWLSARPVAEADRAMDSSGIIGQPIGSAAIERLLRSEYIPYNPADLIRIAEKEFAWCDQQMILASRAMGFGTDWKKALEKVKEHYVEPGDQPALVHSLQEKALSFIDSLDLLDIPPLAREVWRMDMLSTQQQKFASYFLGGPLMLIAYPTAEMSFAEKMMSLRSNNYAFSNAVVYHELIPGHNLQYFMGRRYKPYRKVFSTPFSVEGWAFYWEMLLWDKGYDRTPEEKIGALFWRMTRCARVIFSLNYHLGNWTPQQCIDYLVERVGLEPAAAESEVRRSFTGGYGPLYQLAYMFGALQLYSLHKEMVGGGRMSDKAFHDAYLKQSTIPVELFRAIIMQQKLPENFTTKWRFYVEQK